MPTPPPPRMPTPGVVQKSFLHVHKALPTHSYKQANTYHTNEYTVELQWLEHLWNHENMFETHRDSSN